MLLSSPRKERQTGSGSGRRKGSVTGAKRSHRHIKAVVISTTAFIIAAAVAGGLLLWNRGVRQPYYRSSYRGHHLQEELSSTSKRSYRHMLISLAVGHSLNIVYYGKQKVCQKKPIFIVGLFVMILSVLVLQKADSVME